MRVLIVEDSPLIQQLLVRILSQDPAFEVVGTAADGESALTAVENLKPDVITMDIQIKQSNGLDVTREIMQTNPVPIVVISTSCTAGNTARALEIMEAGALAAMPKPPGVSHPEFARVSASLRQTIKDMAAVKVVRRRNSNKAREAASVSLLTVRKGLYKVLAVGASTGGPPAVLDLLTGLSPDLPIPVLLVQHIYPGFADGLADWLSARTSFKVSLLDENTKGLPGHLYMCQNGYQMGIRSDGVITVAAAEGEMGHCPSVSHLFSSVAESYGACSIGVLLSGMGSDGAEELRVMRQGGALTIAQDETSALVYGMPREAQRIGAADHVAAPKEAAKVINRALGLL